MLLLFLYAVSAIWTCDCRKTYDIESEAMKLYGEDLNSVLLRFRKSPEYLNILTDKADALKEELEQMIIFVQEYWLKEMTKKVYKDLSNITEESSALRSRLANKEYFSSMLRQQTSSSLSPIDMLDTYKYLHKGMSAADVNYFKDIGFEYAGQTIHKVIYNMNPATSVKKQSTRQSDDKASKHVKDHVVTYETITETADVTKYHFRVRQKKPKKRVTVSNQTKSVTKTTTDSSDSS